MAKRKALIGAAVGMAFGAVAGFTAIKIFEALTPPHFQPAIWTYPLILLGLPLTIALHELGHVAIGLACGFEFYLYVVGPLRIDRLGTKLRINWNRAGAIWGGLAACAPSAVLPGQKPKMLMYAAGGPLFSLLGAAVLIPARIIAAAHPNFTFVAVIVGMVSGALGLLTILPMRTGGFVSDGGRIRMLLRNEPEGMRWVAMGALAGLSMVERPKKWPADLMEQLGDGNGPDGASISFLRHMFHRDRGEMELARDWLERGLRRADESSGLLQGALFSLAAYFYARQGCTDASVVRDYYDRAAKTGWQKQDDLRLTLAAVLIAEGRKQEAKTELDHAMEELRKKPPSIAEALREDIEEMR